MPCRLDPGADFVASQGYGRVARFKEEQGFPQCQKIFGHGMMLTLYCCHFVVFLFFKTYNYHIHTFLIRCGTDPFLLGCPSHFQA